MWNAYTPTQNILFAALFWTESNEKCIQTKGNERQRAKRDFSFPIVNLIRVVAYKDLKKPLWTVPTQLLGRTPRYAWFKWSEYSEDETFTGKVWLFCGFLLCLEFEQRITKRKKKGFRFKKKKQSHKKLQSIFSLPVTKPVGFSK